MSGTHTSAGLEPKEHIGNGALSDNEGKITVDYEAIDSYLVPAAIFPNTQYARNRVYWDRIREIVTAYDPQSTESEHMRPHQVEAVNNFREAAMQIADGTLEGGLAILHPTGSGKTVTATEIIRMVCERDDTQRRLRALMLVPGYRILDQTVGADDELGAIRTFAPKLTVGEYSGDKKSTEADVTVMNYQALSWAIQRGDIAKIDPDIIVCDEAHHLIDGTWARDVETISRSKLLVGVTATPVYSESRNVTRLFPNILSRKTMKEGIEEGVLSSLQGYVYRGKTRISISRAGADYNEQDLFESLANSEDNYLAAKICALEVARGRRGIVSCVPGFDRAHAKIMAKILSHTKVNTPDGERYIRAESVDSTVHPNELQRIFRQYQRGEIDVITYVNLLLEGWDSPGTDFTVLVRPTASRVLAEQRIGRILRPREGKLATVHEIIYELEPKGVKSQPQVTHHDIMGERVIRQGYTYRRTDSNREANKKWKASPAHIFSIDDFRLDPELIQKVADLDAVPLEEVRVACGQEAIPFDWLTSHLLSVRFDMHRDEIEAILRDNAIPSRVETYDNVEHHFFPPRASHLIAETLGLELMPDGYLTLHELQEYHRGFRQYSKTSKHSIESALDEEGIAAKLFLRPDGSIVRAYPQEAIKVTPVPRIKSTQKYEEVHLDEQFVLPEKWSVADIMDWLNRILVDPTQAASAWETREIHTAQSCLLHAIEKLGQIPHVVHNQIRGAIERQEIEASNQMKNVMTAKKLDLIGLVAAAVMASTNVRKLKGVKGYTSQP